MPTRIRAFDRRFRNGLTRGVAALMVAAMLTPATPTQVVAEASKPATLDNPDAVAYARRYDLPVDEAIWRLDVQGRAGVLSAWLDENAATWSGGLYVQHEPTLRIVVLATTMDVPGLSQAAATAGIADLITVVKVDATLAELTADANALAAELSGGLVYVDVRSNAVVVEGPQEASVAAAAQKARVRHQPTFVRSDRQVIPAALTYAGKIVSDDIGYLCTTGFSMVKSGVRRLTTAAHCPLADDYDPPMRVQGVSMGIVDSQYGGSHDELLLSVGTLTPTNRTHDGSRDTQTPGYRLISGKITRANQAIGSYYCRYGWSADGNFGCGHLASKTVQGAMPNAALTSMLLEADSGDDLATGGDSGGPVFTFGGALGLIHGCVGTIVSCGSPGVINDMIYVAINYVESGLSATLLTSP